MIARDCFCLPDLPAAYDNHLAFRPQIIFSLAALKLPMVDKILDWRVEKMTDEIGAITTDQCRHIGCVCEPLAGENYCSPHCEGTAFETPCACGHAECQTNAAQAATQTGGL